MRRIGFRLQLRTMMFLVAIVAMTIGGESMRRRWSYHRAQATKYAEDGRLFLWGMKRRQAQVLQYRKLAEEMETVPGAKANHESASSLATSLSKEERAERAKFYRWLEAKYKKDLAGLPEMATRWKQLQQRHAYAASHPWLRLKIEPYPY